MKVVLICLFSPSLHQTHIQPTLNALQTLKHEVLIVDATDSLIRLLAKIEHFKPDVALPLFLKETSKHKRLFVRQLCDELRLSCIAPAVESLTMTLHPHTLTAIVGTHASALQVATVNEHTTEHGMLSLVKPLKCDSVYLFQPDFSADFLCVITGDNAHLLSTIMKQHLHAAAVKIALSLLVQDFARVDFVLNEHQQFDFLHCDPWPSLDPNASFVNAMQQQGFDYHTLLERLIHKTYQKQMLEQLSRQSGKDKIKKIKDDQLVVGFSYNLKRIDASLEGDDSECEFDAPQTIHAIHDAIASWGYRVEMLEATTDLPRLLTDSDVDVVFNIAEGIHGSRNREALVPALCELLNIPYSGSDAATLAVCLDKALSKKILLQQGILTPQFQTFITGKEKLNKQLKFPLIVKPNQEGSSKGIGDKSVVDTEDALRAAVQKIIHQYNQPALVEEYIFGRELTVGLLGEKKPRVLPPMEIVFLDNQETRPVYDFAVKQDWKKQVQYVCPASIKTEELKAIERVARDTFMVLGCRDVARVDLRMNPQGEIYVLEVNPLPGLTPGFSDLVLIAQAAGIDYRTLVLEIMSGALKRLKEKKKEEAQQKRFKIVANA